MRDTVSGLLPARGAAADEDIQVLACKRFRQCFFGLLLIEMGQQVRYKKNWLVFLFPDDDGDAWPVFLDNQPMQA
jgi:hypothetical protein